jgi:hypothetical protein
LRQGVSAWMYLHAGRQYRRYGQCMTSQVDGLQTIAWVLAKQLPQKPVAATANRGPCDCPPRRTLHHFAIHNHPPTPCHSLGALEQLPEGPPPPLQLSLALLLLLQGSQAGREGQAVKQGSRKPCWS